MEGYRKRKQKGDSLLDRQDYLLKDLRLHSQMADALETRIDDLYSYLSSALETESVKPDDPNVLSIPILNAYRNLGQAHEMYIGCKFQLRNVSKSLEDINDRLSVDEAVRTTRKKRKTSTKKSSRTSTRKKGTKELPLVSQEDEDRIESNLDDLLGDLFDG